MHRTGAGRARPSDVNRERVSKSHQRTKPDAHNCAAVVYNGLTRPTCSFLEQVGAVCTTSFGAPDGTERGARTAQEESECRATRTSPLSAVTAASSSSSPRASRNSSPSEASRTSRDVARPAERLARRAAARAVATRPVEAAAGTLQPRREMFPAVCAQCGKDTMVPFQPSNEQPVYCSECYSAQRGNSRGRY